MSRTLAVMKREFVESVRTRTFVAGIVLGPLLLIGLFAIQFYIISASGGGRHALAVVDATGAGLGDRVAAGLGEAPGGRPMRARAEYTVEVVAVAAAGLDAERDRQLARVGRDDIAGVLVLPAGLLDGESARYEGENATSTAVTTDLRLAIQQAVQVARLDAEGIDPARLAAALAPVPLEAVRVGERGVTGSVEAARVLGFLMGMAIYLVVLLYGAAVMNGVLEEKRDRVVELIVSSIRAQQLMLGKVVGIGGAGLLQMTIWVAFAGLLLAKGSDIASLLGADEETIRALSQAQQVVSVPPSAGVVFLFFFAGGFFLYSTLYAVLGAVATTSQEAQQLTFPIVMPLVVAFLMSMASVENPDSAIALTGSLIPFTSPLIMPVRAVIGGVPLTQLLLSMVLLVGTGLAIIWAGGKIYRIGIFATGKRPSARELWHWLRTA
jgi:ABC-2 type transport system permease protein